LWRIRHSRAWFRRGFGERGNFNDRPNARGTASTGSDRDAVAGKLIEMCGTEILQDEILNRAQRRIAEEFEHTGDPPVRELQA
jgi:hypothetical protein